MGPYGISAYCFRTFSTLIPGQQLLYACCILLPQWYVWSICQSVSFTAFTVALFVCKNSFLDCSSLGCHVCPIHGSTWDNLHCRGANKSMKPNMHLNYLLSAAFFYQAWTSAFWQIAFASYLLRNTVVGMLCPENRVSPEFKMFSNNFLSLCAKRNGKKRRDQMKITGFLLSRSTAQHQRLDDYILILKVITILNSKVRMIHQFG